MVEWIKIKNHRMKDERMSDWRRKKADSISISIWVSVAQMYTEQNNQLIYRKSKNLLHLLRSRSINWAINQSIIQSISQTIDKSLKE